MADEIRFFELNTGAKIPSVGLGTYTVGESGIEHAIKVGYRHIDCASIYGNEKEVSLNILNSEICVIHVYMCSPRRRCAVSSPGVEASPRLLPSPSLRRLLSESKRLLPSPSLRRLLPRPRSVAAPAPLAVAAPSPPPASKRCSACSPLSFAEDSDEWPQISDLQKRVLELM